MPNDRRTSWRLRLYSGIAVLLAGALAAHPAAAERLIVKYRQRVDACVHCLLAHHRSLGSDSLDRLHREIGVRSAKALVFDRHTMTGGRAAAWRGHVDGIRARFSHRSQRTQRTSVPDLSRVYVLEIPPGTDAWRAAGRLAADPDVEYAEPVLEYHAMLTPNDPFFASSGTWGQPYADLWGLHKVNAATGWNTAIGAGTIVAVVDTGVDYTHPDLAANMWTNSGEIAGNGIDDDDNGFIDDVRGWDFANDDNDPDDFHFHGTHCAGTIAAVGNNGTGVVGLAWGARIMAVQGLGGSGAGLTDNLAEALVYAAENGADVISNSWGGFGHSQTLVDAVATARGLGAVVVAAAGNNGSDVAGFEPANILGVIAVGATDYQDHIASFSNFGDALSVSAPGVDVLSTRAPGLGSSTSAVATNYLRASGTSMATPHVAGLAAVLLSAQPSLTVDEVRWHLELNAHQPGAPGWVGEPWNPYFGWGRIDAANVFDPVPVTTRLKPRSFDVHTFAGTSNPDVAAADLEFTTAAAVPWTLTSPSWLPPSASAGSGPEHVSFSVDGTGLLPGLLSGQVIVDAPSAADGGASLDVNAQLHRDERIGGTQTVDPTGFRNGPQVATDGVGSLVVWTTNNGVFAARVDGAGVAAAPVELAPGAFPIPGATPARYDVDVASDGRNFLVTWVERAGVEWVRAMRVGPDGQPLDSRGAFLASRLSIDSQRFFRRTHVAFDGDSYVVLWDAVDLTIPRSTVSFRRVGRDGTLRTKPRKIYPARGRTPTIIDPRIGCAAGRCVMAWSEGGAEYRPLGKLTVPALGFTIVGSKPVQSAPLQLLIDADAVAAVTPGADGFAVLAWRTTLCSGDVVCGESVIAGRLDPDGIPGNPVGTRLDVGPPAGSASAFPTSLGFDGTNWIATFLSGGWIFAGRMDAAGTRLDDELIGLLVSQNNTFKGPVIVGTNTHSLAVWSAQPAINIPGPLVTQRVLAHPTVPAIPATTIGAIGERSGTESQALAFTVSAPTLDPDDATYSATNLPAGAVFDAATRTFRWVPGPDQAGTYAGVHFEATDGVQTVSEDVPMTASEANHSIGGIVRNSDLSPAPLVLMRITGTKGGRRMVLTDAAGRYRFDDLPPRSYRVRLDNSSAKQYLATPVSARPVVVAGDVRDVDFVVAPR